MTKSIWYILEYKYLKNFSQPEMRNKITFAYEFIGGIVASSMSVLGGLLLKAIAIKNAFLIAIAFNNNPPKTDMLLATIPPINSYAKVILLRISG